MKVKELIEKLQSLDPELEVFVSGYEGGFYTVTDISEPEDFTLDFYSEWYYGPHELLSYTSQFERDKEYKTTRGVIL